MQQTLQQLPLTLAYIGADLVAIGILVGALYIPRHGRRDLVAAYIGVNVGVLAVTLLLSSSSHVGAGPGRVAYFFAALALGLLGGIQSHLLVVSILMVLILAALWVGDHPGLMRYNRNQTVTLDRAIPNENDVVLELERLLGAQVRSVDLKNLDLVNDITIVDVHYKLRSQSRASMPPAQQDVLLPSQQHEALLPQQQSPPQQQSESAY